MTRNRASALRAAACCFANRSAAASPKTVTYRSSHIWELLSRKAAQGERVVVLAREGNHTGIAAASVTAAIHTVRACGSPRRDRKSTRLNSSHLGISYAVF